MTEIAFPKKSNSVLKLFGRSFIALCVVVLVNFIWYEIRNRCDGFFAQDGVAWLQLFISWLIVAVVVSLQAPKSILPVLLYTLVIGLLVGAVSVPCREETDFGEYVLDILQGVTVTMAAGATTFGLAKLVKWY